MSDAYDVIVVGARCAGSPTGMLLARQGYRVLVVDRATFPSDTVSNHLVHPPGVAALQRWGLLGAVEASGCPRIERYSFDFGPFVIDGGPHPVDGIDYGIGPRRTILDSILVDAAANAGCEVREGFSVDEIMVDDGRVVGITGHDRDGTAVVERASIVVGADGSNSKLARAVGPTEYHAKPPLQAGYYSYWSDLPVDGMEITIRPDRGFGAFPTNDGLTLVVVGWPFAEHAANKRDVEANYLKSFDLSPAFAERMRGATRQDRFYGSPVPNFFRQPYGPGWALVGDAGYTKDPITAQGISDAFADAERVATAIDTSLSGRATMEDAMGAYQAARDEHALPIYEFTGQLASMEPPPPEMQQLLGAVHGSPDAMSDFVSVYTGTLSPAAFFDPAYVGRLLAAAGAPT